MARRSSQQCACAGADGCGAYTMGLRWVYHGSKLVQLYQEWVSPEVIMAVSQHDMHVPRVAALSQSTPDPD